MKSCFICVKKNTTTNIINFHFGTPFSLIFILGGRGRKSEIQGHLGHSYIIQPAHWPVLRPARPNNSVWILLEWIFALACPNNEWAWGDCTLVVHWPMSTCTDNGAALMYKQNGYCNSEHVEALYKPHRCLLTHYIIVGFKLSNDCDLIHADLWELGTKKSISHWDMTDSSPYILAHILEVTTVHILEVEKGEERVLQFEA